MSCKQESVRYLRLLQWFIFIKGLLKTLDSHSKPVVVLFGSVNTSSYLYTGKKIIETIHVKIQHHYH